MYQGPDEREEFGMGDRDILTLAELLPTPQVRHS